MVFGFCSEFFAGFRVGECVEPVEVFVGLLGVFGAGFLVE